MSNEAVYGPVADSAATRYGVDPGLFRRLIASESSWNPVAINPQSVSGENASGIAQFLPSTAAARGIDPFNPNSALDGAAQYLSELIGKYGISGGIAAYKGYSDKTSSAAQATAAKIIGDGSTDSVQGTGYDEYGNPSAPMSSTLKAKADASASDKSFWQYNANDWKALLQNSAWGFLFGLLGILLVIFSVYMLTRQGGTNSLSAVRKVGGV